MNLLSRSEVIASNGIVCSASPLAASHGLKVLMEGGNAFDAALVVASIETVTLPSMCGLGGDTFALLYNAKSNKMIGINGSGAAPSNANLDYFKSKKYDIMPQDGPLAVTIPGEVSAWETIHEQLCTWPFDKLLSPAIKYAREGFPLPQHMGNSFSTSKSTLKQYPSTSSIFLNNGRSYSPGDYFVNYDLANTLESVAKGGAEEFYRGALAHKFVKELNEFGGLFTEIDFASHTTEVYDEPLSTTYRDTLIYQTRPPSQGFIMLEMLNLIEGFDPKTSGHLTAESIHLMVESKKLAFNDRNRYLGDPKFIEGPLKKLISKQYANEIRSTIDHFTTSIIGQPPLTSGGSDTSYFCVADKDGNCVSFIHSIFKQFGSGFVANGTGVVFNNRAGAFSLEQNHPNMIQPGKRPMHTLNCYMATKNGKPWLIGGTPGADLQPQCNTQIITSIVDHQISPQTAIELPRWWSFPGTDVTAMDNPLELRMEPGFDKKVVDQLNQLGHNVIPLNPEDGLGRVQLIQLDNLNGILVGASDPRADGHAVGF